MFRVVLLCAGGASTGILAKKMEAEAKVVGLKDCAVHAYGIAQASAIASEADVIMLGPQVGYQIEDVKKNVGDLGVCVIDREDYGRLNVRKILAQAVKCYKENKNK